MTVRRTVRAAEPTAVFSPQRKYKTVGSSPHQNFAIRILSDFVRFFELHNNHIIVIMQYL